MKFPSIPKKGFCRHRLTILKFIQKIMELSLAETIFKRIKWQESRMINIKTFYMSTVIKLGVVDRGIYTQIKEKKSEINPYNTQLMFDQVLKTVR